LVLAALKANLEIRWSQILMRIVTVGSFSLYATLFFLRRSFLAAHYNILIWGIYFGLIGLATVIGIRRLLFTNPTAGLRSLRFFLPRGFWRYTLLTQQVSLTNFFINRLDLILVLNFGGLKLLGKYVAVVTAAEVIRTANLIFLDTLLPSLTNTLAIGNLEAASQIFAVNLRILFLVNGAATFGLILLSGPIAHLLGPQYSSIVQLLALMVFFVGTSTPGAVGGTVLSSLGKQQWAVAVRLGQLAMYVLLFWNFWPRWNLLGAVLASGVAMLLANVIMLLVACGSFPVRFGVWMDYAKLAVVGLAAAFLTSRFIPSGLGWALFAWTGVFVVFVVSARYSVSEIRGLAACFLPEFQGGRRARQAT
jgi:O-antigen/teichoic acid export membrane protein